MSVVLDSCDHPSPTLTVMSMKVIPKIAGAHPTPMCSRFDFITYETI